MKDETVGCLPISRLASCASPNQSSVVDATLFPAGVVLPPNCMVKPTARNADGVHSGIKLFLGDRYHPKFAKCFTKCQAVIPQEANTVMDYIGLNHTAIPTKKP